MTEVGTNGWHGPAVAEAVADVISSDVAHHVLWHYGCADPDARVGYEPGAFIVKLMSAIAAADGFNRAKLYLSFPAYVAAAALIEQSKDGVEILRKIARGEVIPDDS
jgi:hypothetical protein